MEFLDIHNSSSIKWAGYNKNDKILYVGFADSEEEYEYIDVPAKKWKELKAADSKGKYINQHIKPFHEYYKIAPK